MKNANKVYTIHAKGGFIFAWITKPFDSNKEAFLSRFLIRSELMTNRFHSYIYDILVRRFTIALSKNDVSYI